MQRRKFIQGAGAAAGIGLIAGCMGEDEGGNGNGNGNGNGYEIAYTDEVLTGHGTGGGFDQEIRIASQYMAEEFGSNAQVENMTGAGGQVMYEHLWENVDPGGETVGQLNAQNSSTQEVLDDVPFDASEWTYLGQKSRSVRSIIVRSDAASDIDEFVERTANGELLWVTTDPAGGGALIGAYMGELSGLWEPEAVTDNLVVVDSTGDAVPLMGSDDADVLAVSHGTAADMAADNDHIDMLIVCTTGDPPEGTEDASTLETEDIPEGEAIEDAISQRRMIVAPPGMEDEYPDRHEELVDGMENVLTNEDFVSEMEEAGRSPEYLPPDEAQEAVEAIRDTHRDYIEILER